jgi:glycosyltransferase involved in cell wall biosynthesis
MRIGIDARELCGRATGVGRYLGGLLREWSTGTRAGSHEFVLYAPEPIALALDPVRFTTRVVAGAGGSWWEQVQAPRAAAADRLDAWFAPAYTAPLRLTVPIVVAIHDLSFVAHPEWFRFREGVRRRWLTRQAAHKATSVITISQFTKRELIEQLDVPEGRIFVIPPGIDAPGSMLDAGRGAPHEAASSKVLFVGSIFNRRHVTDLVRAFAPIARAHPGASLDIVGDHRSYPHQDVGRTIAIEALEAQVRLHQYVTDEQLRGLYANARAFAFLSEYEGLGLTPLEALAAGVPPVLLDTAVARESCNGAALYVPVGDLRATTRALESLLFDETVRARILDAAPGVVAKYNWTRAAADTLAVIERA